MEKLRTQGSLGSRQSLWSLPAASRCNFQEETLCHSQLSLCAVTLSHTTAFSWPTHGFYTLLYFPLRPQ